MCWDIAVDVGLTLQNRTVLNPLWTSIFLLLITSCLSENCSIVAFWVRPFLTERLHYLFQKARNNFDESAGGDQKDGASTSYTA